MAGEEIARGLYLLKVLLAGDIVDAWRGAVLKVRVQTMPVVPLRRSQGPAAAQMILPAHQRQRAAQRAGIGKWPEVACPVILLEACQGEPGNRIIEIDLEQQETFVVPKTDVVTRMEFFDQFAFEQQRLGFAADEMEIEIMNAFDERLEFQIPAHSPGRLEVLADPLAQIPGFADINHGPEAVAHQVNARLMRQGADFLADIIGHWHATHSLMAEWADGQVVAPAPVAQVRAFRNPKPDDFSDELRQHKAEELPWNAGAVQVGNVERAELVELVCRHGGPKTEGSGDIGG